MQHTMLNIVFILTQDSNKGIAPKIKSGKYSETKAILSIKSISYSDKTFYIGEGFHEYWEKKWNRE